MDRFQPTTLWGVAAYRMWTAAAFGFTSCAASYVVAANCFVSNARRRKVIDHGPMSKEVGDGSSVVPGSEITINNNVIQKPDTKGEDTVRTVDSQQVAPKQVFVRSSELESTGTQMNLGTEKDFTPKPIPHGYPGKKRKNRPETKGSGSQTESTVKTKSLGESDTLSGK